jgi:hypothetical protein
MSTTKKVLISVAFGLIIGITILVFRVAAIFQAIPH